VPTVLIVDDDPIVRNVARLALARSGHAVIDANGAAEASTLCRSLGDQQIDLLIIDHRLMPGVGREVAENILTLCPALKVLVISGWPYHQVQEEDGIPPGGSFLQKPFTPQQLLSTVQRVLFPSTQ
jgi:DNA-binding NtrC family response regulator